MSQIVLVRHGRLAWDFRTPIPGHALGKWLEGEDAAPLEPSQHPSADLERYARSAGCLVASPLRRSVESAHLVAPSTVPLIDEHFREAALPSAIYLRLRLRPDVWTWFARAAWFCGWSPGVESFKAARERASRAAGILARLAERDAVVLIGHGLMNILIAGRLRAMGWRGSRFPRPRHWAFAVYDLPG